MRSRIVLGAAIATLIGGCASATGSPAPGSPGPSSVVTVPPPSSQPTSGPTSAPTSAPGCPSPLPTQIASVDDLAEPACYGTTDLTIDGWLNEGDVTNFAEGGTLPTWTLSFSQLSPGRPTVGDYVYDFLFTDRLGYGLSLVTKPGTDVDLADVGRSVRIRGHYNDPEVLGCTRMVPAAQDEAMPSCDRLFTVTGLVALPAAVPACPGDSPIALADYMAADVACFLDREVRITGWEDPGEGFGGVNVTYPVVVDPSVTLAGAQLTERRWESGDPGAVIFPWRIKGSGVRFDEADQKVLVTGQIGHPTSKKCRPEVFETWTWSPPDSWAQHRCEHLFVISAVSDRG